MRTTRYTRFLLALLLPIHTGCVSNTHPVPGARTKEYRPGAVVTWLNNPKPMPGDGKYVLTLENAVRDGAPLDLHIGTAGGLCPQAWAVVPPGTNIAHKADATRLFYMNGRLAGEVDVEYERVNYTYAIDLPFAPGTNTATGSFDSKFGMTRPSVSAGEVTGKILPRADPSGEMRVELHLGISIHGPNDWHRKVLLALDVKNNNVVAARASKDTPRSVGWQTQAGKLDATIKDSRLAGDITMSFINKGRRTSTTNTYTFTLDAAFQANLLNGTVVSRSHQGKDTLYSRCYGAATAAGEDLDRRNAVYKLALANAADSVHTVELYVPRVGNTLTNALILVPRAWKQLHQADVSQLRIDNDAVSGTVAAKIDPAGWPGWHPKPTLCEFTLEAVVTASNTIAGSYTRKEHTEQRKGCPVTAARESWKSVRELNRLADGMDFPNWRGPFFNGTGPSSGHELVDDLAKARLAWRSSETTPDSWVWSKHSTPSVSGGYSSPVIVDNRIYFAYYVNVGDVVDTNMLKHCDLLDKWRVDADDVVLCVDAETGHTIWRTTYCSQGMNLNHKMSGPHMTTCVSDGRVYAIGSMGNVYCLDTVTGKSIWQSDVGPRAAEFRAVKKGMLEKATIVIPKPSRIFCGCPIVADGVVLCNNYDDGLIGLDADTGRHVWGPVSNCISKGGTPTVWEHEGTQRILTSIKDRLICLEPRTGNIIWETNANMGNEGSLALARLGDEHYVATGGGFNCFRITPEGAKEIWNLGGRFRMHVTSPLIYRDHVYPWRGGPGVCVDLKTGKIKGEIPFWSTRGCSSFVASDGRIVRPHLRNQLLYYNADPNDFRQLGEMWRTSSFAGSTSPTLIDGRLFFRGSDCVYCYDLRK